MDIKIEPEDHITSTNSPDNTYYSEFHQNKDNYLWIEGRSTEHRYDRRVKQERCDDDDNRENEIERKDFKANSRYISNHTCPRLIKVSNLQKDSSNDVNYEQILNVKSEQDDTLWENCKDDVSGEQFTIKKENLNIGEFSYTQHEKDQLTTVDVEAPTTTPHPSLNLSMTPPAFKDNKISPEREGDIKKETSNQKEVAVIILDRADFYEQNFVCSVCFSIFDSNYRLKIHKNCHNASVLDIEYERGTEEVPIEFNECYIGVEGLKFEDCDETYAPTVDTNKSVLPLVDKPFKCNECDYSTVFSFSLKTHIMTHTGEKPFKCDECDYRSTKSSDVKRHKLKHTNEKPFKCDQCNFKTAYSSNLKTHKMSHSGETALKNDIKSMKNLKVKRNVILNSGDKPFKCDQCEFKSVRSNDLKRHKMFHTGEKPYNCDICDYKTAYFTHLKMHKMSHYGEKPWKCDSCDYTSTHASNLKTHKMLHSGEKPFKCDLCEFKSVRSTDLKRHKMSHSGEKPFHCDVCSYKTAYCTDLKKHKLIHVKNAQV